MNTFNHPPCKECGKTIRHNFNDYCMDCADENGVSNLFTEQEREKNQKVLNERRLTPEEKRANIKIMGLHLEQCSKDGGSVLPILVIKESSHLRNDLD